MAFLMVSDQQMLSPDYFRDGKSSQVLSDLLIFHPL